MSNPVRWFEVYGNNGVKSQEFYANLFNWEIDKNYPMGYGIVEPSKGGIRGGIGQMNDLIPVKGLTFYVEVDNLEDYLTKAVKLGAEIAMPSFQIPEGGPRIAIFKDIDGNCVGLMERDVRFYEIDE